MKIVGLESFYSQIYSENVFLLCIYTYTRACCVHMCACAQVSASM